MGGLTEPCLSTARQHRVHVGTFATVDTSKKPNEVHTAVSSAPRTAVGRGRAGPVVSWSSSSNRRVRDGDRPAEGPCRVRDNASILGGECRDS